VLGVVHQDAGRRLSVAVIAFCIYLKAKPVGICQAIDIEK
jgi:hypothetical protein